MATCRDANSRNGARAIASSTKACELTDWKDAFCLTTLAAAQAETGDFEAALRTIRESRKHARTGDKQAQWCDYLETLFAIGKPYHDGDSRVEPRKLWAWLKSAFFG